MSSSDISAGLNAVHPTPLARATAYGDAIAWGAAFGLVLYGVFELKNDALIAGWPWKLAAIDVAWGCALCGAAAAAIRWAGRG